MELAIAAETSMSRAGTDSRRELEALHPASFRWALGCCDGDRDAAEETLQTTYLKILEGRARFRGESSFRTFLFGVIRRSAAEHRRRRFLGRLVADRRSGAVAPQNPAGAGERMEERERARLLRSALLRLSRRQREVLALVFDHDMTVDQAAAALGISAGSARVHFHRGKRKLRGLLQGDPQ